MSIDDRLRRSARDVRTSLDKVLVTPTGPHPTRRRHHPRRAARLALAGSIVAMALAGVPLLVASITRPNGPVADGPDLRETPTGTGAIAALFPEVEPILLDVVSESKSLRGAQFGAITRDEAGLIAGGARTDFAGTGATSAALWRSHDGIEWSVVESPAFVVGDGVSAEDDSFVADVAVGPYGLVAVGAEGRKGSDDYDAVAWFSADGDTWIKVTSTIDGSGDPGPQIMRRVVAGGTGWVAIGSFSGWLGETSAVWTSVDGISWSVVEVPRPGTTVDITGVAALDSVVVAVGHTPGSPARSPYWADAATDPFDRRPLAWRSAGDGVWEWIALPLGVAADTDAGGVVDSVVVDSAGRFVAVGKVLTRGADYFDRVWALAVWTSEDGREWYLDRGTVSGLVEPIGGAGIDHPQPRVLVDAGGRLLIVANCVDDSVPIADRIYQSNPWLDYHASRHTSGCVLESHDEGASWEVVAEIPSGPRYLAEESRSAVNAPSDMVADLAVAGAVVAADGRLIVVGNAIWVEAAG